MARNQEKKVSQEKVSREFAVRLERLNPEDKVRAIVMLDTSEGRGMVKKRPTKTARRAAIKNTRQSVAEILPDIDRILRQHHGKRLKSEIDALSAVPVITTPAGIEALTASSHVKAILEDQALYGVR